MQYVALIASKRNTYDRYWFTRKTLAEIKEATDGYSENDFFISVYQLGEEL